MKNENFVDTFTTECLNNGKCTTGEICDEALNKIEEIDESLKELFTLRMERDKYMSVLKAYNHESVKTKGKRRTPIVNPDLSSMDYNDPAFLDIANRICLEVEKSSTSLTSRRIISSVGFESDPTPVYISLKWLVDKGILTRKEDRSFLPGSNWDQRKTTKKEA